MCVVTRRQHKKKFYVNFEETGGGRGEGERGEKGVSEVQRGEREDECRSTQRSLTPWTLPLPSHKHAPLEAPPSPLLLPQPSKPHLLRCLEHRNTQTLIMNTQLDRPCRWNIDPLESVICSQRTAFPRIACAIMPRKSASHNPHHAHPHDPWHLTKKSCGHSHCQISWAPDSATLDQQQQTPSVNKLKTWKHDPNAPDTPQHMHDRRASSEVPVSMAGKISFA